MKILITGGAGYLGTTLVPLLLFQGHYVTVLDSLLFGGDALLPFFRHQNFRFVKGDVRDERTVMDACKGQDAVIHLAALVGAPICSRYPEETQQVNMTGTENVLKAGLRVLYASTVSVYGKSEAGTCTEESAIWPLSHYGKTKAAAEMMLMDNPQCTAFRLATAFGISPRMRLDLLINDFTYQAVKQGSAVVYESHFIRPFVHVQDIAQVFLFSLENSDTFQQVYNVVGANCTKKQVCDTIKRYISSYFHFAEVGSDADARNYNVSTEKILRLGFVPKITVDEGVEEMVRGFQAISIHNPFSNA